MTDTKKGPPSGSRAQHQAPEPLLYSLKDARTILGGVPESTFETWIRKGIITPVRVGLRRTFIRRQDILRLVEFGRVG